MDNKPTILTKEDIDKVVDYFLNYEIKPNTCFSCGKEYYFESYGHHICECDECWFKRFPKDQVEAFYRSFFE